MRARRREAGYNLVILMVAITLLNIAFAIVLPLWSQAIQRDREEELIFRGLQYAEAIRLFHARFQRAPVRLEELLEAKPRCIRQLWKDPMTENGKWQVLYEGVQQPSTGLNPQPGKEDESGKQDEAKSEDPGDEENGQGGLSTEQKEALTIGPIVGVRSRSTKDSILIWFGTQRYNQWEFRWTLLTQKSFGIPGQTGTTGQGESIRWLGRPWPKRLNLPGGPPAVPADPKNRRTPPPKKGGLGGGQSGPNGGLSGPGDPPAFGVPGGGEPVDPEPPPEPKE
ncbi:MAG TPA: type II secretion system protein [Thermoanaerobaculia bacterium]|nr:type II secretion system protein [Thermoanaerobaculia bacterium]